MPKKNAVKLVTLSFSLNKEIKKRLIEIADEKDVSIADVLRSILKSWYQGEKK